MMSNQQCLNIIALELKKITKDLEALTQHLTQPVMTGPTKLSQQQFGDYASRLAEQTKKT